MRVVPRTQRLALAACVAVCVVVSPGPEAGAQGAFTLLRSVPADTGGFFAGDVSEAFDLIAIGPHLPGQASRPGQPLTTRGYITFFNADGDVLSRTQVGGTVWALAMTPDGSRTVAGSDDEKLYVFNRTTLVASGVPVTEDHEIRGIAVSNDGRYAGVGGAWFTLHDLSAVDPIRPIYTDTTSTQTRAVAFSANGRYVAYGGWNNTEAARGAAPTMYLAVYDVQVRQRIFTYRIAYPTGTIAELRHVSISSDGNKIVAGNWANHVLYFVRSDPASTTWALMQDIPFPQRLYWTAMDPADSVVAVGEQSGVVLLYAMEESALTPLWERREGFNGGPRTVGISADGAYVTATTRGSCGEPGSGGRFLVWSREGEEVFNGASAEAACGGPSPPAESWFGAIASGGSRLVYAGWGGLALFYQLASP